jgi:trk system potassium uptake protein TrkH
VLKYFGLLYIAFAIVTIVPFMLSLLFGDYRVSLRYSVVIIGLSSLGLGLMRVRAPERIQTNEAMVITALMFIFSPLVMTWPAMASGLGFLDALFETVSAVTSTGLSTAEMLLNKPDAFLFSRAWMQWIGDSVLSCSL